MGWIKFEIHIVLFYLLLIMQDLLWGTINICEGLCIFGACVDMILFEDNIWQIEHGT